MKWIRDLAHVEVQDLDGKSTLLREFWTERPAVLVFVRHFG